MEKAKTIWTVVTTHKISKKEAKKLYEESIQKEIKVLTREKSNSIKKYNILNILENVGSIFTADTYLHCKELPKETEFERSIAERTKLSRQSLDEVKKKEKNINNELFSHYFNYSSPSNMGSRLGDAKGEVNKDWVYLIKKS